jgi:hypothetical protein
MEAGESHDDFIYPSVDLKSELPSGRPSETYHHSITGTSSLLTPGDTRLNATYACACQLYYSKALAWMADAHVRVVLFRPVLAVTRVPVAG